MLLFSQDKPDDLGNETMLRAATALLSDPEEQVVAAACTIFRNLSISNQGVLLVASTVDVVEKITNILTSQPVKTTPMTILPVLVAILANVTRVFKGASVCSQFPVLAPVLEILKKAILYPSEMLLHAVLVIGNFATHDQGKREAISMGAVEICLKVLAKVLAQSIRCDEEKQVELARCLIGAIMGLSTYEEAKPRLLEYGVEPLVACLKHRHPSIKRNAIIAVNSACESPLGATYFTQKLLAEKALLVEVLGVKAIPALNKSLMGLDEDDKVCALDVLVDLCEKDADRATEEVVQCLEMLDNLIELAHDPQREIHQRATQVLHQMVKVHRKRYSYTISSLRIRTYTWLSCATLVAPLLMAGWGRVREAHWQETPETPRIRKRIPNDRRSL